MLARMVTSVWPWIRLWFPWCAENAGRYGSRDVRRGLPGLCPLLRLHGRVSRTNLCEYVFLISLHHLHLPVFRSLRPFALETICMQCMVWLNCITQNGRVWSASIRYFTRLLKARQMRQIICNCSADHQSQFSWHLVSLTRGVVHGWVVGEDRVNQLVYSLTASLLFSSMSYVTFGTCFDEQLENTNATPSHLSSLVSTLVTNQAKELFFVYKLIFRACLLVLMNCVVLEPYKPMRRTRRTS